MRGGIVNDFEFVPSGDIFQGFNVAGIAVDVYRQDGLGVRVDGSFHFSRVDAAVVRVYVGKHWSAVLPQQSACGGDIGERGGDDLAGDTQCLQGDLQAKGAVGG